MPENAVDEIKVGSTVNTPDGKGKVTDKNDRYISVDLAEGGKRQFNHREVHSSK